jgi:cytochrome c oxidase subunit IV
MAQQVSSLTTYIIVFALLMLLLVATVGIRFVQLGPFNPIAAMGIAAIKALLIVMYFMHVRYSERLIWLVAGASLLWIGILFGLTFSEYVGRNWL